MRDMKRIKRIMSMLEQVWYQHPDLRFFQLVEYLRKEFNFPDNPFYIEDDVLEKKLEELE